MNFFRKIGSIFLRMKSKKVEKLPQLICEESKFKTESIRDIEDIVSLSKNPYFSPIQTRNQRLTKASIVKPIPLLPNSPLGFGNNLVTTEPPKYVGSADYRRNPPEEIEAAPLTVDQFASTVLPTIANEKKTKKKFVAKLIEPNAPYKRSVKTGLTKKLKEFQLVKPKKVANCAVENEKSNEELLESIKEKARVTRSPISIKPRAMLTRSVNQVTERPKPVEEQEDIPPEKQIVFLGSKKGRRRYSESAQMSDMKLEKWEPNNWAEVLENIRLMRSKENAPVDTMGCDKCSDKTADAKTRRFHILVALMLSSQTKDRVTYEAMNRLKATGCTPENIIRLDVGRLETLLFPVSFYKNKAKYLKSTSKILLEQYDSDIPNNIVELVQLPGVGPKMAHICMKSAWNIITGIGVDVHVHRISNRLGWVRKETKDPEQTRKELESWLPSDTWNDVNNLLVGFGQTICTSLKPKCTDCLNNTLCPSANKPSPKKTSKKVKLA